MIRSYFEWTAIFTPVAMENLMPLQSSLLDLKELVRKFEEVTKKLRYLQFYKGDVAGFNVCAYDNAFLLPTIYY